MLEVRQTSSVILLTHVLFYFILFSNLSLFFFSFFLFFFHHGEYMVENKKNAKKKCWKKSISIAQFGRTLTLTLNVCTLRKVICWFQSMPISLGWIH